MRKTVAARAVMVAVGVVVLVLAGSAPAMAGKGPKDDPRTEGAGPPATQAKPPKAPKAPLGSGSNASVPSKDHGKKKGHARGANPSKNARPKQGKGRGAAKGRDKNRGAARSGPSASRPGTSEANSRRPVSDGDAVGTEVLGLRISRGLEALTATDLAAPALFPRAPGEALPLTGGDIAAMMFIGLMVITIGGLIWRAPSLIDKPRRSRDLSV